MWLSLPTSPSRSQPLGVSGIDTSVPLFLQRQFVAGYLPGAHLSAFPLSGDEVRGYLDSLSVAGELSGVDLRRYERLVGDEMPVSARKLSDRWGSVYRNGRDLITYTGDGFAVAVNPLAYLRAGPLTGLPDGDTGSEIYWRNTRGARVSGSIGSHIFFETRLEENQRRDPRLTPDPPNKSATRLGKALANDNGVLDYMVATGIVGFKSRFFDVRFGRDNARLGYGKNSLLLSNYGPVFDQLQIRTTFGRIQYVNIFASLATKRRFVSDSVIPKKYAAIHRLEINATDRLQFAIYESVIFGTDSLETREGFDIAYLNPLIFYRAVEADRGSPDNVLIGASTSYRPIDGLLVFADLLLDELRVSRIGEKWWANKWAVRTGLMAAPVSGLLFGLEYARLRPYLYGHREPLNAYVHYQDFLGHPAGPNAVDVTAYADYYVAPGVVLQFVASRTVRGRNDGEVNYGANPLISSSSRVSDEDVAILQGIRQTVVDVDMVAGYEVLPELFLEAGLWLRRIDDAELGVTTVRAPFIGLRWGLPTEEARF